MSHQKQVWIDNRSHKFLGGLPGTIAGHVRAALRIYIAVVSHEGYREGIEIEILQRLGVIEE